MTAGDIYTVAGTFEGFGGDGGPATSAKLNWPLGVVLDPAGNLVVADFGNSRIRVVAARTGTFYGQSMTVGDIYTVAGRGHGFAGDGGPAVAAALGCPREVAVDGAGNLLIADSCNSRIRVVAASTGTFYGRSMTAGDIYTVAGHSLPLSGNGRLAGNAEMLFPGGVAVSSAANLAIYDQAEVRLVPATAGSLFGQAMAAGHIYAVAGNGYAGYAGDGGPGTSSQVGKRGTVAFDGNGNLLVADLYNNRVRVVAASDGTFYGQAMTAGDVYTIAGNGTAGFTGDGGPAVSAELSMPSAVTVDAAGNVIVADFDNWRVRVVAAATGTFYGRPMTAGDIYTIAGNGTPGFGGDGGPAVSAGLDGPLGVAVDGAGNVLIADNVNCRVRVVAAATGTFYGRPMTAGDIYTIAGNGTPGFSGDGGPAVSAELNEPAGVAVDGAGNVVVADVHNNRARVVAAATGTFYGQAMTAGDIYTIAGNGRLGYFGDSGPGPRARLAFPGAVAVGPTGDVLVADTDNNVIRQVSG
jgi:hypothetical protein